MHLAQAEGVRALIRSYFEEEACEIDFDRTLELRMPLEVARVSRVLCHPVSVEFRIKAVDIPRPKL